MNDIVMIGPQGSGKGTQSDLLSAAIGVPHVSLGTLFRVEVAQGSETGLLVKSYMERGDIVPSEVADRVMMNRMSLPDAAKGLIIDGFPRTLDQADALENLLGMLGRKLAHVVYLQVSDEEAMRRLTGRRVCTNTACEKNYHLEVAPPRVPDVCDACGSPLRQRSDDVPDAITRRLELYHKETVPLTVLYEGLGLLRPIDASRPIAEVQSAILAAIGR